MLSTGKYKKVNFKVLLLLIVYLLIHISNLFFIQHHIPTNSKHYTSIFKRKGKSVFKLQQAAKAIVNETRRAVNQLIPAAVQLFIFLLSSAGLLAGIRKLFPSPNEYLPNHQHAYLRCCVIRIWSVCRLLKLAFGYDHESVQNYFFIFLSLACYYKWSVLSLRDHLIQQVRHSPQNRMWSHSVKHWCPCQWESKV